MKDYSKRDDWKIITEVKAELVKRFIDVAKLKIDCTKGFVEIEGPLQFIGRGQQAMDTIQTIANALKKYDIMLNALSNVRGIKWKLLGWEQKGRHWSYAPTAEIRKMNEKKGLK
ncbi:MAG: hypothetical protein ABII23_07220 [bacterium]